MKRCLISLVLVFAIASVGLGQQATSTAVAGTAAASREDILKLLAVMHVREQMKQAMDQVMKQMKTLNHEQIKGRHPEVTDEDIAQIDAAATQMVKDMPYDGMLDDMIPVYQKHLTKADVDAMVGFYSTPTGQKILGELPAITAEGMQAMQPRMRKMMDDTSAKMEKMAREQAAKKNTKPVADAPK